MIDPVVPKGLDPSPACPFCGGAQTELFSAFGSQLSVSTFWCLDCRSPFEIMKWTEAGSRSSLGGASDGNSPEPGRSY